MQQPLPKVLILNVLAPRISGSPGDPCLVCPNVPAKVCILSSQVSLGVEYSESAHMSIQNGNGDGWLLYDERVHAMIST